MSVDIDPAWLERGLTALAMGAGAYFGRLKRRSRLEGRLDAQDESLASVLRKLVRLRSELADKGVLTPSPLVPRPPARLGRETLTEEHTLEGVARPPRTPK